jgi:hypothetical protein
VRKAMDSTTRHDDERRPFLFGTDKTLTEALDALFSSPPSSLPLRYCSIVGFDVGAALPPNDRHGDKRTTADGRRFMLTTSQKSSIAFRTVMYSNRGSRRHNNN